MEIRLVLKAATSSMCIINPVLCLQARQIRYLHGTAERNATGALFVVNNLLYCKGDGSEGFGICLFKSA